MRRLLLISLYCLLLYSPPRVAWGEAPNIQWQLDHAPDGMMLESHAADITEDFYLAVLGTQRPLALGKDNSEDRGWIGLFSATGKIKEQFTFVLQSGDRAVQNVDAFVPIGGGKFLVAGTAPNGQSLLVAFDSSGRGRLIRSLGHNRLAFIRKLPSGDVVAGGRSGRDLYVVRTRANGDLVWEPSLDRGLDDIFFDAILRDGNVIALDHSGRREQFFMRDAVMRLTVFGDAAGTIPAPSFSIPGRAGAMVASDDGYAVLVDIGAGVQQQLKLIRLDNAFKTKGSTDVLALPFSLERARLARRKDGRYLLVALNGTRLVWLDIDEGGTLHGRMESPVDHAFLHPDIVGVDDIYTVATELKESEHMVGVRKTLHIVKLSSR